MEDISDSDKRTLSGWGKQLRTKARIEEAEKKIRGKELEMENIDNSLKGCCLKGKQGEFPLWCVGNESDWYPQGFRFDPWLPSVGGGSGVAMSCGLGHSCDSDPTLLWLWHRLAAVALIPPLAWELPCVTGAALEKKKKKKKR